MSTIVTINPGSSSTKCGVVRDGKVVLDVNIANEPGEFDSCKTFAEQLPSREKKIFDALADAGTDLDEIDAIAARGVGVQPGPGGTYAINEKANEDAKNDVAGFRHPATLGIQIGYRLAQRLGKPAFFVNPPNTDELCDAARMIGVRGRYRPARSHPLNQKQVAIMHSEKQGKRYEECNYVVAHLGGGISITAHCHGKMIDSTRIGDGQGPISPNRCGDLVAQDVLDMLADGVPAGRIQELIAGKGGFRDLCGTDDLRKVTGEMIPSGNKMARLAYEGMILGIKKYIGAMAAVMDGKVDAVLLTGGLAFDDGLVRRITEACSWIAPVVAYPGSFETEALAAGVERVLSGQEEARVYTGVPAFAGF